MWIRAVCLLPPLLLFAEAPPKHAAPSFFEWERGIGLKVAGGPDMYLWFYEWNMFEAMRPGQHTPGTYRNRRSIGAGGQAAEVTGAGLSLSGKTVSGGAGLVLRITNTTDYAWPEIGGIIPCWSPGQVEGSNSSRPLPLNRNFADPGKTKTFFVSRAGVTPLASREIHFNERFRAAVNRVAGGAPLAFSYKWPTSDIDAGAGYMVRASEDGEWVTAIGWEDYLSVQGHNPWWCMHVCIRVGPLEPKRSKTIRGKLYLFRGSVEECVRLLKADFGGRPLRNGAPRL